LTIGAELLMLGALVAFGRPIAGRTGGWRAGFGLDWIRRIDWLPWITGFGFIYLGRTVISGLANGLTDGKALQQASNVHFGGVSPWAIALFGFVAVVLAPVTEELMFRGLLLRSFMRRMRFWPAALLSTALFALFHVYEVHTVIGAVTLACSVAVLGLGNSYLVRITGRLTPGIMAHACFNALALLVAIAQAAH
jgi:membrane protease YdiL (CAAX protease family)